MPTLYLIRGVPGSGKSTLAKEFFENDLVSYRFEADTYFEEDGLYEFDVTKLKDAHEWCQNSTEKALKKGFNVAVSNTSTTEKEVVVYQQIAELTGSKFVSIIVENRNGTKNIHNVPEEKIQQMKNRFSVKL